MNEQALKQALINLPDDAIEKIVGNVLMLPFFEALGFSTTEIYREYKTKTGKGANCTVDYALRHNQDGGKTITTLKCGITKAKLKDLKQVFYLIPEPLPEIIKDPALLKTLTSTELKNMAKKRGIAGFSKKSKDALVELLSS